MAKTILIGLRVKNWVVVAESEQDQTPTLVLRCTRCGASKKVTTANAVSGDVDRCDCSPRINRVARLGMGVGCEARERTCLDSQAGLCCYHCQKRSRCENACLNTPDKCRSFYLPKPIHEHEAEAEPDNRLMRVVKEG